MIARQDLRFLRLPIGAALVMAALGAVALFLAERQLDAARSTRAEMDKLKAGAQEKVAKASEEEKEIRSQLVFFDQMSKAGLIGARNRLDLIESIGTIKTQRKLLDVKYSIDPQRVVEYPGITKTGAMDFVTNRVQLDMMLLHEEDLLNFFRDLQAVGQSLVSVRECKLTRLSRGLPSGLSPGVQATCKVDLINLVSGKQGEPGS